MPAGGLQIVGEVVAVHELLYGEVRIAQEKGLCMCAAQLGENRSVRKRPLEGAAFQSQPGDVRKGLSEGRVRQRLEKDAQLWRVVLLSDEAENRIEIQVGETVLLKGHEIRLVVIILGCGPDDVEGAALALIIFFHR